MKPLICCYLQHVRAPNDDDTYVHNTGRHDESGRPILPHFFLRSPFREQAFKATMVQDFRVSMGTLLSNIILGLVRGTFEATTVQGKSGDPLLVRASTPDL